MLFKMESERAAKNKFGNAKLLDDLEVILTLPLATREMLKACIEQNLGWVTSLCSIL